MIIVMELGADDKDIYICVIRILKRRIYCSNKFPNRGQRIMTLFLAWLDRVAKAQKAAKQTKGI